MMAECHKDMELVDNVRNRDMGVGFPLAILIEYFCHFS